MYKLKLILLSLLLSCSIPTFAADREEIHRQDDQFAAFFGQLHAMLHMDSKDVKNLLAGSKDLFLELIQEHKALSCCATAACIAALENYPCFTLCTASTCLFVALIRRYLIHLTAECDADDLLGSALLHKRSQTPPSPSNTPK